MNTAEMSDSVLERYEISQYSLSVAMNVERNNVYRWVNEKRDPTAETVVEIVRALKSLSSDSAHAFIQETFPKLKSHEKVFWFLTKR